MIAYAKGARTFERHVDIEADGIPVSPYCTLPEQCDIWFRAYNKAREMSGAPGIQKRIPSHTEIEYLDGLLRGVYAAADLEAGHKLREGDYFMAIPLLHGQLSCRELIEGEVLAQSIQKANPLPWNRSTRHTRAIRPCARGSAAAAYRKHERKEHGLDAVIARAATPPINRHADEVMAWLVELGYTHCFFVAGGNIMHF
jgi:hypothetical protein